MRRLAIALVLAATVVAVFAPALRNGFVNYDDDRYVLRNAHVQRGFDAE